MSNNKNPDNCHICGRPESRHERVVEHTFWSDSDAYAVALDADMRSASYSPEAAYVAEHRPY